MSELLNIWREVASGNRFGETKLVFFIGLCIAMLGLQNHPTEPIFLPAELARGGSTGVMVPVLVLSMVLAASAVIPHLSPSERLSFLIPKKATPNIYYFLDIASFASGSDWLVKSGIQYLENESARAGMIADQIYIIARIATRKFLFLQLSILFLTIGWLVSWIPVVAGLVRFWV